MGYFIFCVFLFGFVLIFFAQASISLLGVLKIGWCVQIPTSLSFLLAHNYLSLLEQQPPSVIKCLHLCDIICFIFFFRFKRLHKHPYHLTKLSEEGKMTFTPNCMKHDYRMLLLGFLLLRLRQYNSGTEFMREYPCESTQMKRFLMQFLGDILLFSPQFSPCLGYGKSFLASSLPPVFPIKQPKWSSTIEIRLYITPCQSLQCLVITLRIKFNLA